MLSSKSKQSPGLLSRKSATAVVSAAYSRWHKSHTEANRRRKGLEPYQWKKKNLSMRRNDSYISIKTFPFCLGEKRDTLQYNKVYFESEGREKLAAKKKLKKEREALGDKAPPKPVPKTIDNQRVYDETTVDPTDEEVAYDEATDEFASYFNRQTSPKILITTSDRPHGRTVRLCEQLSTVIPDSHVYYRRGLALKKIIPQCIARDFTDLIVINEDRKTPNGLILSHLPNGPTAHFKMSSVRLRKEIKRRGKDPTEHVPEIILNNFTTRLGHSIGRMFASLFPHNPQFIGRQVATFHNQRDYIFFRFHRYIFKSEKKVGIQELGPRFTLKLRSLQKGTFDSKYGEYEWVHKPREMDTSRRKFHL
ncbi:ribosome production factor 1-like protein [Cricetulus griseus]|nr:ribosome production factor 1-like protein [Cricetulus griseus]